MDYDKLSYSEAKRLIKVANSAVSAVNSLPVMSAPVAPITTTATPTTTTTATPTASPSFISSIADAGTDWLSKLPEMYKENPVPWNIGIGALGGAALGGLSSLWQPKRRRNLLSRLITGGLIGSMGGLAASGVSGGF